jgi:hypothetical protein
MLRSRAPKFSSRYVLLFLLSLSLSLSLILTSSHSYTLTLSLSPPLTLLFSNFGFFHSLSHLDSNACTRTHIH